tara:strand:+ start:3571 stop:4002 length:432 start_codon:yes stop_codon:yes gene_type:complete
MNTSNQTPYHLFCFVYLGFAQLSNKDFIEKEIEEIQKKIAIWMDVNPSNIIEFNKIMDETINWYQGIRESEKLESVLEIARHINKIKSFTLENKKTFLSDIRDIAVADGRFNSEEKHLHDRIAKELGINMMTIEKNRRKKLGY